MGPPCIPACFSLCGHQRELGAHRGPMLSNQDCAKRQAGMGWGHQPRSATADAAASCGTGTSRAISARGAISEMGIRRQWPPQKRPSYETGEKGVGRAADRGEGGRVICLTLTQFPDAHKYRGDLPEIGRFSSTGGAWRGSSALRGKRPQGAQSIRPGQRNPIARRFPFTRARTTQVDENRPNTGRSPP